jgi:hypothetical protein
METMKSPLCTKMKVRIGVLNLWNQSSLCAFDGDGRTANINNIRRMMGPPHKFMCGVFVWGGEGGTLYCTLTVVNWPNPIYFNYKVSNWWLKFLYLAGRWRGYPAYFTSESQFTPHRSGLCQFFHIIFSAIYGNFSAAFCTVVVMEIWLPSFFYHDGHAWQSLFFSQKFSLVVFFHVLEKIPHSGILCLSILVQFFNRYTMVLNGWYVWGISTSYSTPFGSVWLFEFEWSRAPIGRDSGCTSEVAHKWVLKEDIESRYLHPVFYTHFCCG